MKSSFSNVDEYILNFDPHTAELLQQMRETIRKAAPDAEEIISYGMPGYKLNKKTLVYFAGFKNHIGFYAIPTGHQQFKDALSVYRQGKGSVQFPLDQPLPLDLIAEITRYRVGENMALRSE
jgi:uncharacterized protein YdhG (YjbR/CyaY superfamily)